MDSEAHVDQFVSSATNVTPPKKTKKVSTTANKIHLADGSPITTFLQANQCCHRSMKCITWYKERDELSSQLQTHGG